MSCLISIKIYYLYALQMTRKTDLVSFRYSNSKDPFCNPVTKINKFLFEVVPLK